MVAEPWRSVIRHRVARENGAVEYCIDSIGEPSRAVQMTKQKPARKPLDLSMGSVKYSQGGKVEMFKAAWPHQWIVVAHPPVR